MKFAQNNWKNWNVSLKLTEFFPENLHWMELHPVVNETYWKYFLEGIEQSLNWKACWEERS
jgi:hypothetical protein